MDIARYKDYMFDVVGAIHEVHKELGAGLNEFCYQEGLAMQFSEDSIIFEREISFHPTYHGKLMNAEFRLDFLCKGDIIVECKAVTDLVTNHRAQLFNYMRLLKKHCGILVNFSPKFATIERYLYDDVNQNILTIDGRIIK
ncbi:MAG: GxxExxY protein [Muribaculaceae bacterium]|nr:GxxExxY protein [Muribaculaceae bacterium]